MKVLFVYEHKYPHLWKDGLWAALNLLSKKVDLKLLNLNKSHEIKCKYDFILGWGGFLSPVDKFVIQQKGTKGLCVGGNVPGFHAGYNIYFYETEYHKPTFRDYNAMHAFGINTNIYYKSTEKKMFDYLTVGAFALWKRQVRLLTRSGLKLAVGEIQKENMDESMKIINELIRGGVIISDMVEPEILSRFYNMSRNVYIPADINGGGERSVLEARACGCEVEVESDNPKLKELCYSKIWDHNYYSKQLLKGIYDTCATASIK